MCCLALERKGARKGNPVGYQVGLLFFRLPGTLFSKPLYCAEETVFPDCAYSGSVMSVGVNDTFLTPLSSCHSGFSVLSISVNITNYHRGFFNHSFLFLHNLTNITVLVAF